MAHVIVVGAGPGGAALAYLLARRGIEVTLLERQTDFAREFRGEVLMPSGVDALHQMGLEAAAAAVPQVALRALRLYVLGKSLFRADFGPEIVGDEGPVWMSQPELLEMLVSQAAKFQSFRLERGTTVRDLIFEGARTVGVRAQTDQGQSELRADLVVGADGRGSVVRKRSGVGMWEDRVAIDVVWAKVPLPDFIRSDPHARAYLGHGHLLVAAPTPDDRLQLGWVIRKGAFGELRKRGVAEWIDELAQHVSEDLAAHLRATRDDTLHPFLLSAVSNRVDRWSFPGLLLIGDAAHTMSPVGAQGLNIALRDALVAANHLVPILTDRVDPDAVDAAGRAIEAERIPEVKPIQRLQSLPPYVVLSTSWWSKIALRVLPWLAIGPRGGGRALQRFAFGITDVKLQV